MVKLKKCPFCGHKPELKKSNPLGISEDWVECVNPYCEVWDKYSVEFWNTRHKEGK